MVQNKQKSNKINITAIITCFMLIMMFVFGCVTFAHAEVTNSYIYGEDAFNYANSSEQHKFILCFRNKDSYITWFITNYTDKVALIKREDDGVCYFDLYTNPFSNNVKVLSVSSYPKDNNFKTGVGSAYSFESSIKGLSGLTFDSYGVSNGDVVSVGVPVFSNIDDLNTYLQTGEVNNPIYQPTGYDESIPTPKNLEIYFDRKLNKPFNLADLCNPLKIKWTIPEDEDYSNYTLDVQIDVNYNKLNSISGIGTKPTVLQTGKVEIASCSATDKELNITATYDGWTKLTEKYHSSIWGLTGNYFDIWLRYKDSSGNYGNWVKVTINPDNSSTVIKAGLFDNGTNTTINKGYEEISGDNGEHVSGDYDNYYVGTADENISNNLTKLRENYTNLVSFFKELFGFLPAEIWVILIGLVATMALIAILMFVRG